MNWDTMIEPWNDASLLPPPIHTAPSSAHVDVKELAHICKNITTILSKQSPLHREGAIVSRFLYKFDKKFRGDIGYRYFKKVNTALHRYLTLNFLKDIESFESALPSTSEEYLPTRQMLEYILIRLITFSKLLLRISVCSKQAAIFYLDRLKRGDSYWMCLMPYALLSRVWSISKVLLNHTTRWYNSLYPYIDKLKSKGLQFLSNEFQLPGDLDVWLDLRNADNFGRLEWTQQKINNTIISLDDDSDMFDDILRFVNQTNAEYLKPEINNTVFPESMAPTDQLIIQNKMEIDHGETISRESFDILCKKAIVNVKDNINDHVFQNVHNKELLQKFIDKEILLRNENSRFSLTKHLSFMQFEVLKKSLLAVCKLNDNRNFEKKIQNIWSNKCLYYLE